MLFTLIDGAAMRMGCKDHVSAGDGDERMRSQMLAEDWGLRQFKKPVGNSLETN